MALLKDIPQVDAATHVQMEYSLLWEEYQRAKQRIQDLEKENAYLKEQLLLMKQRQFGKKSEVGEPVVNSEQLQVISSYVRHKGKKARGRMIDTSGLPRHKIYHFLNAEEQHCHCGALLERMGEETSEQLEVVPLRIYVVEHIREKYTCRQCHTIQMAPKPMAPIPKALAGGSLLTEVIINKYQYHLPLYRQSKILESYNALIPDNTLGNWVMQSGSGMVPIYEAFWEAVLEARYLQVDETPIKVLKPEKTAYLWAYYAPHVGKGLVVFEFNLTRNGSVAEERLKSFKGLLQTDGYAGYQNLRARKDVTGFGCMTHGRRKFSEVLKITKNPDGIAAELITRLKPVYALEARMRDLEVSFHTRKRLRQKYAWPLLKALHAWLRQNLNQVPPKSALGMAMNYMLNQWYYLIAYLRHGCVEIDTNLVENLIRPTALGKKNWLFMGHEESGKIHALWFSLIISAIINGLNPQVYIHFLLTKIHDIRIKSVDPKTLLPHTIDRVVLQIFADQQITFAKLLLNSS